jgi:hypothetical protein
MENLPVDPTPINDSFAYEQLANINVSSARISSPWFVDYANFIVGKVIPPHFTYQQKRYASMILYIISEMTHFFIRRLYMVLLDVVYLSLNRKALLKIAMIVHMEATMRETAQLERYYNLVFIGLLYLKIVLLMLKFVINVNVWETLVREMKCL